MQLPPTLNGANVPAMPSLISGMGMGGLGLNVAMNGGIPPPYRTMYPGYSMYPPYGMHPYGLPPAVQPPTVSPRMHDRSRESPLMSKSVRPVTPNSNGTSNGLQPSPLALGGSTTPTSRESGHSHSHPASRTHSPRGHSPSRERDNYRFVLIS